VTFSCNDLAPANRNCVGSSYAFILLLQIIEPAWNIIRVIDVVLADLEITTRALQDKIDELL
jgi:hypothetical protein